MSGSAACAADLSFRLIFRFTLSINHKNIFVSDSTDADFQSWIRDQTRRSAAAMERAVSATGLVRERTAFGQVVVPAPGSVLASPVVADWDPEPDYFFHWIRDSAIVMRSVAVLMRCATDAAEGRRWEKRFEDFVRFSLALCALKPETPTASARYRPTTQRGYRKFLRPDGELRKLTGDRLLGEPRFNADGSVDFLRWSRPQYDGPALRALACLDFLASGGNASRELDRLLETDLRFTLDHADAPCIGPWEEADENTHHYSVAVVQLGALARGRSWAGGGAPWVKPQEWDAAEARLRAGLEKHWIEAAGVYAALRDARASTADDLVDAAQLLAFVDADLTDGPHSACDPRVEATQAALEAVFAREFPINHGLPPERAPALGRSRGDRYFGGGAWYPTTLAAASLCYRRALRPGQDREAQVRRGDAFLRTVQALLPADGSMSEQVDRATGAPTSARHLTWSYAAFIAAAGLREEVFLRG